jgi:hypothetical protein
MVLVGLNFFRSLTLENDWSALMVPFLPSDIRPSTLVRGELYPLLAC